MDIRTLRWSRVLLRATLSRTVAHSGDEVKARGAEEEQWVFPADSDIEELRRKLGEELVPAGTHIGKISSYFVDKYGFSPVCAVAAFSGDNPCRCAAASRRGRGRGWWKDRHRHRERERKREREREREREIEKERKKARKQEGKGGWNPRKGEGQGRSKNTRKKGWGGEERRGCVCVCAPSDQ